MKRIYLVCFCSYVFVDNFGLVVNGVDLELFLKLASYGIFLLVIIMNILGDIKI